MLCTNCFECQIEKKNKFCPHCGISVDVILATLLPPSFQLQDGRYEIDFPLGQGGFGVTYRAQHTDLGGFVAIKEFFPKSQARRDITTRKIKVAEDNRKTYDRSIERFMREGRTLFKLQSANVVRVTDLFRENETAYLVMELLEGRTLREVLDATPGKKLDETQVLNIVDGVVKALEVVHRHQIYHLDISPDNIILRVHPESGREEAVLIDFGAAYDVDYSHSTQLKDAYAPIEMYGDESMFDHRTDIFELGMVMHEMITGEKGPRSMLRRLSAEYQNWAAPLLAPHWREVVLPMVALTMEERPSDLSTFWRQTRPQPVRGKSIEVALELIGEQLEKGGTFPYGGSEGQFVVKVPPLSQPGQVLILQGKGHPGLRGGTNGDVLVKLTAKAISNPASQPAKTESKPLEVKISEAKVSEVKIPTVEAPEIKVSPETVKGKVAEVEKPKPKKSEPSRAGAIPAANAPQNVVNVAPVGSTIPEAKVPEANQNKGSMSGNQAPTSWAVSPKPSTPQSSTVTSAPAKKRKIWPWVIVGGVSFILLIGLLTPPEEPTKPKSVPTSGLAGSTSLTNSQSLKTQSIKSIPSVSPQKALGNYWVAWKRNDLSAGSIWAARTNLETKAPYVTGGEKHQMTPLMVACYEGRMDWVRMLVKNGANLNARDEVQDTPLHWAAINENDEVLKYLLSEGVAVNSTDDGKSTALHQAVANGSTSVIVTLLSHGANIEAKDKYGYTPLDWAVQHNQRVTVDFLITHGANINARNNEGATPLHTAASKGATAIAQILVSRGANIQATDKYRLTPLHYAASDGQPKMAEWLLLHGANTDVRGPYGRTPLHLAAYWGKTIVVAPLLAHGANLNARDTYGDTPLSLAKWKKQKAMVSLLKQKGAK